MKSTTAPKHARPKKALACPQIILRLYEILEADHLEQIAAGLRQARQAMPATCRSVSENADRTRKWRSAA